MRLVFATLVKASENWHDIRMTPEILLELDRLRGDTTVKEWAGELVAV